MIDVDVIVIGGGPAGLSAAIGARENGAKVVLIEREKHLGGILKQCIHHGFGLLTFGKMMTGPEYVGKFITKFKRLNIKAYVESFVIDIVEEEDYKKVTFISKEGIISLKTRTIVLATGCRERTSKQVGIHGQRPSGVMNAGTAQYYINILGEMPIKNAVILGSGDIGLIMARRITLEGGKVIGVYEAKGTPSGLMRNISQCLDDFNIPLYLNKTVTRIIGDPRIEAVEIATTDEKMNIIKGSEEIISCDSLILSVGLIPENEICSSIGVEIDGKTKGAYCTSKYMTSKNGIFSCGNSLFVNDLVDYVTEVGLEAGKNAAKYKNEDFLFNTVDIEACENLLYVVPQKPCINEERIKFFTRSKISASKVRILVKKGNEIIYWKDEENITPQETIKFTIKDFCKLNLKQGDKLFLSLEVIGGDIDEDH